MSEELEDKDQDKRFSKEDINNLVYEFRDEQLEGWDESHHYNAECWSGMKDFIQWLNARCENNLKQKN